MIPLAGWLGIVLFLIVWAVMALFMRGAHVEDADLDAPDPCPECNAPLRLIGPHDVDADTIYTRCDNGHTWREERLPWATNIRRVPELDVAK